MSLSELWQVLFRRAHFVNSFFRLYKTEKIVTSILQSSIMKPILEILDNREDMLCRRTTF